MDHVAIMKRQWGLIPKIISGEKTVESRWYKNKTTPWNKVNAGDTIYFKNSGEKVCVKAKVTKVEQYDIQDNYQAVKILEKYILQDLGTTTLPKEVKEYITDKNYAIFAHLENVQEVKPFEINKKGFGAQTAWLTVDSIKQLQT